MGYQIVIRSYGMGLYSVEKAPPDDLPITQKDVDDAAREVGSKLVAFAVDADRPERAFMACSEGHWPGLHENAHLTEDGEAMSRAALGSESFGACLVRLAWTVIPGKINSL